MMVPPPPLPPLLTSDLPQSTSRTAKPSPLGFHSGPSPRSLRPVRRDNSGSFSQLAPSQISQLKESFSLLDKDGDGAISAGDLAGMLASLGLDASATGTYLSSVPTPFNLASYLTHLSQHLSLMSPGPDLMAAFAAFDENDDGTVDMRELSDALRRAGMRPDEVDRALAGFTKRRTLGKGATGGGEVFRYRDWVDVLIGKEGEEEKE